MRGLSPTGISARTAQVIASTIVIESLSGLTATTSLPSGDTATAAAEIGRGRSTAEVELTVGATACEESVAMAVGSTTGLEPSDAVGVAGIGRLIGTVEVGLTVGAAISGESAAMTVGSVTGVEASNVVAPGVRGMCSSDGTCAEQAASRRADNPSAIRAAFEGLLRLIFHLIEQR